MPSVVLSSRSRTDEHPTDEPESKVMRTSPKAVFAALFVFLATTLPASAEPFFYVLLGQSNALGVKSDAAKLSIRPKGQLWWRAPGVSHSNGWVSLRPQRGLFDAGHFGPEMGIADITPGVSIYKFAKGGTNLAQHWGVSGGGGLYDQMAAEAKKALAGRPVRCVVWVQGESDADSPILARIYHRQLRQLVASFRRDFGADVRIVLSLDELHPSVIENPQVADAQKAMALDDPLIEFVGFSDLPKADRSHPTPEGTVEQGRRYGRACAQ
jgi:hypothetical protein